MSYYSKAHQEVQDAVAQRTNGRVKLSEVAGGFIVNVWLDSEFAAFSKFYGVPVVEEIVADFQVAVVHLKAQEAVYNAYGTN